MGPSFVEAPAGFFSGHMPLLMPTYSDTQHSIFLFYAVVTCEIKLFQPSLMARLKYFWLKLFENNVSHVTEMVLK